MDLTMADANIDPNPSRPAAAATAPARSGTAEGSRADLRMARAAGKCLPLPGGAR